MGKPRGPHCDPCTQTAGYPYPDASSGHGRYCPCAPATYRTPGRWCTGARGRLWALCAPPTLSRQGYTPEVRTQGGRAPRTFLWAARETDLLICSVQRATVLSVCTLRTPRGVRECAHYCEHTPIGHFARFVAVSCYARGTALRLLPSLVRLPRASLVVAYRCYARETDLRPRSKGRALHYIKDPDRTRRASTGVALVVHTPRTRVLGGSEVFRILCQQSSRHMRTARPAAPRQAGKPSPVGSSEVCTCSYPCTPHGRRTSGGLVLGSDQAKSPPVGCVLARPSPARLRAAYLPPKRETAPRY
jgi:hypothetical protein